MLDRCAFAALVATWIRDLRLLRDLSFAMAEGDGRSPTTLKGRSVLSNGGGLGSLESCFALIFAAARRFGSLEATASLGGERGVRVVAKRPVTGESSPTLTGAAEGLGMRGISRLLVGTGSFRLAGMAERLRPRP